MNKVILVTPPNNDGFTEMAFAYARGQVRDSSSILNLKQSSDQERSEAELSTSEYWFCSPLEVSKINDPGRTMAQEFEAAKKRKEALPSIVIKFLYFDQDGALVSCHVYSPHPFLVDPAYRQRTQNSEETEGG